MRKGSLADSRGYVLCAALLAAHGKNREGFRQRDVRLFTELFFGWVFSGRGEDSVNVSNVQISRLIEKCLKEGDATQVMAVGGRPIYRLTPVGILNQLLKVGEDAREWNLGRILFVRCFLFSYAQRIRELAYEGIEELTPCTTAQSGTGVG
jgi:hypothetical protein